MTIATQLTSIANTKSAIKTAIEAKGVTVGTAPFADYPTKIAAISGSAAVVNDTPDTYVRPSDWLTLPTLTAGQQKWVGLHAVFPDGGNFCSVQVTCVGGFTVDWGDGTVETFASAATAYHTFSYSNAALVGSECSRGYRQAIVTITPTVNGASLSAIYTQIKHNQTGLTNTYTSGWLDVALVGASITTAKMSESNNATPVVRHGLLERYTIVGSTSINTWSNAFYGCSKLQSVTLTSSASITSFNSMFSGCGMLQSVPLFETSGGTDFGTMFANCFLLRDVPLFNTGNATAMGSMFSVCRALKTVPLFNTAKVTDFSSMFNGCNSLQAVPLFNTGLGTNFSSMFLSCVALTSVPLFNTANATNMSSMFSGCSTLTSVPNLSTGNNTNFSSMFSGCQSLVTAPTMDTSKGNTFSTMFSSCYKLKNVPAYNTALGTLFSSMFANCLALTSVPLFDTSKATSMTSMFSNCQNLRSVPAFNTALCINFASMFASCVSLEEVPALNTTAASLSSVSSMFNACSSLTTIPDLNFSNIPSTAALTTTFTGCSQLSRLVLPGLKYGFTVANCKLSSSALDALYTSLGTAAGAQTITVTGNYGVNGDDPTIATAKGWTVTG